MRNMIIAISIAGISLAGAAWAPAALAQGRGGGGGRGGGMGGDDAARYGAMRDRMEAVSALDIAPMWAILCFESGATAQEIESLRGPFSDAWKERASVLKDAESSDKVDWDGIKREFTNTKEKLDGTVKTGLATDEYQRYTAAMDALEKARPRMRGGRPGGGGPGGPGGPGGD